MRTGAENRRAARRSPKIGGCAPGTIFVVHLLYSLHTHDVLYELVHNILACIINKYSRSAEKNIMDYYTKYNNLVIAKPDSGSGTIQDQE